MRIISSASARPNFVKLAAVHHALALHPEHTHKIIHTGQHYDPLFSDVFFQELSIPEPKWHLHVSGGATREESIVRTMEAMMPALEAERPDILLVYGDVNGAVGAARAAQKLGIRLGHVEAGLRSFDLSMPEELNRIEIDQVADLLFVSEQSGMDHLAIEGQIDGVHFVGNTMIETLIRMRPAIDSCLLPATLPSQFGLVTLHRPSNVDSPETLRDLLITLSDFSRSIPLVFPLHRRTKAVIDTHGLSSFITPTLYCIDPLPYIAFLATLKRSCFILTDSGGVQEEATFLQKKCFTLRSNTERPSTLLSGSNTLIDLQNGDDRAKISAFISSPESVNITIPEYWDGKTGERIVELLSL
jgi:UDP-N-acetylglucosamine 2-epimerase (non-hydrolysing)